MLLRYNVSLEEKLMENVFASAVEKLKKQLEDGDTSLIVSDLRERKSTLTNSSLVEVKESSSHAPGPDPDFSDWFDFRLIMASFK